MAQVVLPIAVSAIPGLGPVASAALTAVAAAAGSYIDNKFIFPADNDNLFPSGTPDLPSTAEGGPAIHCLGVEAAVPGQVLWISPFRPDGAGGQICDIAVAVANHPIEHIEQIIAEGHQIYTRAGTIGPFTSTDGSLSIRHFASPGSYAQTLVSATPGSDVDLMQFRGWESAPLTMEGWPTSNNDWGNSGGGAAGNVYSVQKLVDGTAEMYMVRPGTPTPTTADNESSTPGVSLTLEQTVTPLNASFATGIEEWDGSGTGNVLTTLGTGTDTLGFVSSVIAAFESLTTPGDQQNGIPHYEGISYFVLENFKLAQFGNRVPSTWRVIVRQRPTVTTSVKTAMAQTMLWGGLTASDYDVSGVPLDEVKGYTMLGNISTAARLQPLMMAYDLIGQQRGEKIHFFQADSARSWTVDESEWGAAIGGGGRPLEVVVDTEPRLPSAVTVHFRDQENGWEPATVDRHRNSANVRSQDVLVLKETSEVVMTSNRAETVSERLLWTPVKNARKVSGTLGPKYEFIGENDIIQTTHEGSSVDIMAEKVTRGANGIIEVEGYIRDNHFFEGLRVAEPNGDIEAAAGDNTDISAFAGIPSMSFRVMDLPALSEQETSNPHVYAQAAPWSDEGFTTATIDVSDDSGANWKSIANVPGSAVTGFTLDTSNMRAGMPRDQTDTASYLDVEIVQGELASVSADQFYDEANLLLVGSEIVCFQTATLTNTKRYRLTNFLRGCYDTEVVTHGVDFENVALLSDLNRFAIRVDWGDLGVSKRFRALARNGDATATDGQDLTPTGANLRPYRVTDIQGTLASGDWTITWDRRTRYPRAKMFSAYGVPDVDPRDYQVEILDGPGGTVQRTENVANAESFAYTSAMQTTDFGGAQSGVYVRIARVSTWGVGKTLEASLGDIQTVSVEPIAASSAIVAPDAPGTQVVAVEAIAAFAFSEAPAVSVAVLVPAVSTATGIIPPGSFPQSVAVPAVSVSTVTPLVSVTAA